MSFISSAMWQNQVYASMDLCEIYCERAMLCHPINFDLALLAPKSQIIWTETCTCCHNLKSEAIPHKNKKIKE